MPLLTTVLQTATFSSVIYINGNGNILMEKFWFR